MKLSTRSVARSYPAWTAHSGIPVDDMPVGIDALGALSGTNAPAALSININARYQATAAAGMVDGRLRFFSTLQRVVLWRVRRTYCGVASVRLTGLK